ncbi:MAG TPA: SPFH domain-containing protein [Streptomyces sp.]|nr:SPFH domain-containing protein [Streptomyces sp.]
MSPGADLGVAIVRQYQRGVVFRFGKFHNVRQPGIRFMIPLVDRMWKVTLRTVTMPIQSQQVITQDNVSIGVAAVAYFRRVDPVKSITAGDGSRGERRGLPPVNRSPLCAGRCERCPHAW